MAVKIYKPTTASRRSMTGLDYSGLSKNGPEKSLLKSLKRNSGRNNMGRITVRHRGGGNRRKYRIIDFKRRKEGMKAVVKTIEYDPNRTCNISLIEYDDGVKSYILAPHGLKVGDVVCSGAGSDIKPGNSMALESIPVGTMVHNVELSPNGGGTFARSAGAGAQLMAKEGAFALLRMPSGELRQVPVGCFATVGQVGNLEYENVKLGKAGRARHRGFRPSVRGSVMNPNDHPHGGGEGKSPVGRPGPVTPWGKPALGFKTRKKNKSSNKYIIKRRNEK